MTKNKDQTQEEIKKIALVEKLTHQEVLKSIINQGIRNYWLQGSMQSNIFDQHAFLETIKIGQKVLANGIVAIVTKVIDENYFEVEICSGTVIKISKRTVSDTLED